MNNRGSDQSTHLCIVIRSLGDLSSPCLDLHGKALSKAGIHKFAVSRYRVSIRQLVYEVQLQCLLLLLWSTCTIWPIAFKIQWSLTQSWSDEDEGLYKRRNPLNPIKAERLYKCTVRAIALVATTEAALANCYNFTLKFLCGGRVTVRQDVWYANRSFSKWLIILFPVWTVMVGWVKVPVKLSAVEHQATTCSACNRVNKDWILFQGKNQHNNLCNTV